MLPWQPIETAPKDGSDILLFCLSLQKLQTGSGNGWFQVGYWGCNVMDEEGWTEVRDLAPLIPTHWCPLTPPTLHEETA